jgi:hypothetical protein
MDPVAATKTEPKAAVMSLNPDLEAPKTEAQMEQEQVMRLRGGLGYTFLVRGR